MGIGRRIESNALTFRFALVLGATMQVFFFGATLTYWNRDHRDPSGALLRATAPTPSANPVALFVRQEQQREEDLQVRRAATRVRALFVRQEQQREEDFLARHAATPAPVKAAKLRAFAATPAPQESAGELSKLRAQLTATVETRAARLPIDAGAAPPAGIREGGPVKCLGAKYKTVYRYTHGAIRPYPSAAIARSWEAEWKTVDKNIDCSNIPRGPAMTLKARRKEETAERPADAPAGIGQGTPVKELLRARAATLAPPERAGELSKLRPQLTTTVGTQVAGLSISKYLDNQKSQYRTRALAPPERAGELSKLRPQLTATIETRPAGLSISKYLNNEKSQYRNILISKFSTDAGPAPLAVIHEGAWVKCHGASNKTVYRYTGGTIRLYPSSAIARSWEADWKTSTENIKKIDCSNIPRGPAMTLKVRQKGETAERPPEAPAGIREGTPVKCNGVANTVYRYTEGKLRMYPSPAILSSWHAKQMTASRANWATAIKKIKKISCDKIPRGPAMALKAGAGTAAK